jgi:tripartite-type tricarboxylate transporter receptor subunit TctC
VRTSLTKAILTGVLALTTVVAAAQAGDYPARPVRILMGYAAGGTGDLTMRLVSQRLGERLGHSFVIENAPSAGGVVASQRAARATPDGYTLNFIATGNFAMTPSLFKSLPFDPQKDFEMVGRTGTFGFALVVSAASKVRTMADLIAEAKARPGALNIGTVAIGSAQYLSAELFKSMAGIEATTVPYKTSGDVVSALRAGDIDVAFETIAPIAAHVKAQTLRAIAFTEAERFPGFPDVPTVREGGLRNYEVSAWNGVAAPAGTPKAIIDKLNGEINKILAEPELQAKFIELGVTARGNTPAEMTALLARDIGQWREVVERARLEKQ